MNLSIIALAVAIVVPIVSLMIPIYVNTKNWRDAQEDEKVENEKRLTKIETQITGIARSIDRLEARI